MGCIVDMDSVSENQDVDNADNVDGADEGEDGGPSTHDRFNMIAE